MISKLYKKLVPFTVMFFTVILHMHNIAYGEELNILNVGIKLQDGESIIVKDDSTLYTALPVVFYPDIVDGYDNYYCISSDKGKSFGEYTMVSKEGITLYPNQEKPNDSNYVIRFKAYDSKEDISIYSADYTVQFDFGVPEVEILNEDVLNTWIKEKTRLRLVAKDKESTLSRIIAYSGNEVIYDSRNTQSSLTNTKEFELILDKIANNEEGELIKVCVYDVANNCYEATYRYYLDYNEPSISFDSDVDGSVFDDAKEVIINLGSASKDIAYVKYDLARKYKDEIISNSVISKIYPEYNYLVVPIEEEGSYELTACAMDNAGNISKSVKTDFILDKSAPEISISGVTSGVDVNKTVDVQINAYKELYDDCVVNIEVFRKRPGEDRCILREAFNMEAVNELRTITLRNDGEYYIVARATDRLGKVSSSEASFRIDKSAPFLNIWGIGEGEATNEKPTINVGVGDMFYNSTILAMTLLRKDNNGVAKIISDDKYVLKNVNDNYNIQVSEEGEYSLLCTASDRTGNVAAKSIDFTVDYTPPIIRDIDKYDGKFYETFMIPNNIRKLISDMSNYSYDVLLNDEKSSDGNVILEEGKYVLRIGATDIANNYSDKEVTFIVDHTAPQIVIGGLNKNGDIKKGKKISISLVDAIDELTEVLFNDSKVELSEDNKKAEILVNDYGDYKIEIKAKDKAGNETDKVIYTSCAMVKAPYSDYVKSEKIIRAPISNTDKNDINYMSTLIGVFTMLAGTFGLVLRGVSGVDSR